MTGRRRRLALGLAASAAGIVLAVELRPRIRAAAASLQRSSSPSARLYDLLAGRVLGGFYDLVAGEAAAAVEGLPAPAVLEVGPGPGDVAIRLARRVPGLRLSGLDLDPAMVALAARKAAAAGVADRVRFVEGSVSELPFPDASFDLVLSAFSAHHWLDPAAGFGEIRRVLRPSGLAIVYDLPDRWGRLETGAPGLAGAARAGGFTTAAADPVRWPGPVALVRRMELQRP